MQNDGCPYEAPKKCNSHLQNSEIFLISKSEIQELENFERRLLLISGQAPFVNLHGRVTESGKMTVIVSQSRCQHIDCH